MKPTQNCIPNSLGLVENFRGLLLILVLVGLDVSTHAAMEIVEHNAPMQRLHTKVL